MCKKLCTLSIGGHWGILATWGCVSVGSCIIGALVEHQLSAYTRILQQFLPTTHSHHCKNLLADWLGWVDDGRHWQWWGMAPGLHNGHLMTTPDTHSLQPPEQLLMECITSGKMLMWQWNGGWLMHTHNTGTMTWCTRATQHTSTSIWWWQTGDEGAPTTTPTSHFLLGGLQVLQSCTMLNGTISKARWQHQAPHHPLPCLQTTRSDV